MANTDAVESGSSSLEQGPGNLGEAAAQGQFSANMGELAAYIHGWRDEADSLVEDGIQFKEAAGFTHSPVNDPITRDYFNALAGAFTGFATHNGRIYKYTGAYVDGLRECAKAMNDLDDPRTHLVIEPPSR